MKRGKKLLSLLAVLACVLGATWAVSQWDPERDTEETVYETIFQVNADEVTAITWDYSEKLSFVKEGETWVYADDPAFPLKEDYIQEMLTQIKQIRSAKRIEDVENWDQYTLEVPICQVTVTAGGSSYTLKIGEETSLGGERYLSLGDGNAYLVDAGILDAFAYGLYDVLAYETVPAMDTVTALDFSGVNSFRIQRQENSGLAYSDDYIWFIDGKALDTYLTEQIVSRITNLSWQDCADYNAEDLSRYGLDAPAAVTAHYTDSEGVEQTYTIEIGAKADSGYYARVQGSSMVYRMPLGTAETLLYTTYEDLLPDEVLLMDWEEVTSIEVTLDGETYQIKKSTKTVTDDEGNETEETVYKLGGIEVDAQTVMDTLDAMESTGYANGLTPERGQEIRFLIRRKRDTYPKVELVFYQYNSSSCMVTLNGEATVFVAREDVVDLVEDVNALVLN